MARKQKTVTLSSIDDLAEAPYNPRKIDREARHGLGVALNEFGDLGGITWNARTGHLVSGHQRVAELRDQGAKLALPGDGSGVTAPSLLIANGEVFPVRVVDWDEVKESAANITANNPALQGTFTKGLDDMLRDLANQQYALYDQLKLPTVKEAIEGAGIIDGRITDEGADEWQNSAIKQLTFYFSAEEFEALLKRLDALMGVLGVESHTSVFNTAIATLELALRQQGKLA